MPALKRKPKSPQQQQAIRASAGPGASRPSGASGGVQGINVIILVLVAASVTIAAGLLAETVNTARSIDAKAKSIRSTGIGINESTDAIRQLVLTNKVATSILKTASPLQGVLAKIEARAKSINSSAGSIDSLASTILSTAGTINTSATTVNGTAAEINSTAGTINNTAGSIDGIARQISSVAGTINRTAKSINSTAGTGPGILGIARTIDGEAAAIVSKLNTTIDIARGIKVDSGNILVNATNAVDNAGCIDLKLPGGPDPGLPGDCAGKPQP